MRETIVSVENPEPDTDAPAPVAALGPTRVAALLIGATAAMTTGALALRFDVLFDAAQTPSAFAASSVIGAAMIAVSIGVRLPQRIAVWVCANAWRRVVSREEVAPISEILLGDARTDRYLYWTVLSVVALGAGVLAVTLPVNLRIASAFYAWLQAHFLWPAGPLALLQAAIVFALAFLPLAMVGIAVSCTHHLSCRHGRWETAATAWLIIGAGTGCAALESLHYAIPRADLLLVAGALPAFVLSLVAALACSRREPRSNDHDESAHHLAPIAGLQRPRIVRIGIVVAASTAACLIDVSLTRAADSMMGRATSLTLLLLATGVGALAGCGRVSQFGSSRRSNSRSIEAFGITCLCAGVLAALSTGCAGFSSLIPGALMVGAACAGTFAAALAMAYGRRTLIQRVASRSNSGAVILARSLMYAGLTVWIFTPTMERIAGPQAPPLVLALVLVAVGGMLVIRQAGFDAGAPPALEVEAA